MVRRWEAPHGAHALSMTATSCRRNEHIPWTTTGGRVVSWVAWCRKQVLSGYATW